MSTYIKNRHKENGIEGVIKWIKEMAEIKWLWTVLNITGYTAYIYALFISFANVDIFTRTVLSLVGLAFLIAKLVVFIFSSRRKGKLENIQIRRELNAEREKELKIREREIKAYEKETDIIKGFNKL